jgi:hypothetical protein
MLAESMKIHMKKVKRKREGDVVEKVGQWEALRS